MTEKTKQYFEELSTIFDNKIHFPPPFIKDVELEVLEYEAGESVKLSFPISEKYNNPLGVTFGGFFGVFFDAAFGPFSGLVTEDLTTSLDLNITFIKALSPRDKSLEVSVTVVSLSKTYLLMEAKAHKPDGTLVATANTRMLILNKLL